MSSSQSSWRAWQCRARGSSREQRHENWPGSRMKLLIALPREPSACSRRTTSRPYESKSPQTTARCRAAAVTLNGQPDRPTGPDGERHSYRVARPAQDHGHEGRIPPGHHDHRHQRRQGMGGPYRAAGGRKRSKNRSRSTRPALTLACRIRRLRVEVLQREEVEEKMLMTPGDIVMMLNEMGGMRVQTTSPSLGAASVRMQGMRGRYTRFLSDGLPLFGQQGAGLGLLQIPPVDLGQVEVIKGNSSALYGAGAMAGVVNLIARRPTAEPIREFLFNRTTLGGTDASGFYGSQLSQHWGMTVLGSGDWQATKRPGWRRLGGPRRLLPRTRAPTLLLGQRKRQHGAPDRRRDVREPMRAAPCTAQSSRQRNQPYREALDTRRYDVGGNTQWLIADRYVLATRFSASTQQHEHQFGEIRERDTHELLFGEVIAARHHRTPHLGRRRSSRTRRVPTKRRPTIRVHLRHARRVPAGRHDRHTVALRLRKRPSGLPQSVRHVLQPTTLRTPALGRLDEPRLRRTRILRTNTAHRGNRSRRTHAPPDASRHSGQSEDEAHPSTSRAAFGPVSVTSTFFAANITEPDLRQPRRRLRDPQSHRANNEPRRRTPRHLEKSTLQRNRILHLRPITRTRNARHASRHPAHATTQPRTRRRLGARRQEHASGSSATTPDDNGSNTTPTGTSRSPT